MARDLDLTDDEINNIVAEAVALIITESGGDRSAQLSAAMGTLMWFSREFGSSDADIVDLLSEMFASNPRKVDA